MISLNNVYKSYYVENNRIDVLKNISIEIADGEFVGIIGKSGSGKSTLLRCIGLMDSFDSGNYHIDNNNINYNNVSKTNKIRKDYISFVFQHYELLKKFSVYENVEIPLLARNIRLSERRKKIEEGAKKLGIDGLLSKYPHQLSGGQQQRVGVLRAIVAETPIVLADEPTGALDTESSEWVIDRLKDINKSGKTIIVVSHDEDVIKKCNRVIEIREGILRGI